MFLRFLLCLILSIPFLFADKTAVRIAGINRAIDKDSKCSNSYWNNNPNAACQCCVVKNKIYQEDLDDDGIINQCKKGRFCVGNSLSSLKDKLNLKIDTNKEFVKEITTRSITIPSIELKPNKSFIDDKGMVSELGASYLVAKALGDDYSKGCFYASQLKEAGAQTLQLFKVIYSESCDKTIHTQQFILKGTKKGLKEAYNLSRINASQIATDFGLKSSEDYGDKTIAMALDNSEFYYTVNDRRYYMELIPMGRGTSLYKLMDQCSKDGSKSKACMDTANAFYALGRGLAKFHRTYQDDHAIGGLTFIHGDLHPHNVMVDIPKIMLNSSMKYNFTHKHYHLIADDDPKKVFLIGNDKIGITLIDNETMAVSLDKKQPIDRDVLRIYAFSTLHLKASYKPTGDKLPMDLWHTKIMLEPFLLGYIDGYPAVDQPHIYENLRTIFLHTSSIELMIKLKNVALNPFKFWENKIRFIRPVFKSILEIKGFKTPHKNSKIANMLCSVLSVLGRKCVDAH
jgi:hypothetical protein